MIDKSSLYSFISSSKKRKIFTSYHHKADQKYYDELSYHLSNDLQLFSDRGLDEPVRSDDHEYINRTIRENHIVGSSLTIVLCGAETYKRKYVDWEIHSTLHHKKALLGIILPSCSATYDSKHIVPDRLYENIQSGYAHWIKWNITQWVYQPTFFLNEIETAIQRSNSAYLIVNYRQKLKVNSL